MQCRERAVCCKISKCGPFEASSPSPSRNKSPQIRPRGGGQSQAYLAIPVDTFDAATEARKKHSASDVDLGGRMGVCRPVGSTAFQWLHRGPRNTHPFRSTGPNHQIVQIRSQNKIRETDECES